MTVSLSAPRPVTTLSQHSTVSEIKAITDRDGVVIVPGLIPPTLLDRFNAEVGAAFAGQQRQPIVSIDVEGMTIALFAGYLKPEEAHCLVVSRERARELPERLRQLLGFSSYYARANAASDKFAMAWQYEVGDAAQYLDRGPVARVALK